MYHFGCSPSDSAAPLVAVYQSAHLVGPRFCFLVDIGLVISNSVGVLLLGCASMFPELAAALL